MLICEHLTLVIGLIIIIYFPIHILVYSRFIGIDRRFYWSFGSFVAAICFYALHEAICLLELSFSNSIYYFLLNILLVGSTIYLILMILRDQIRLSVRIIARKLRSHETGAKKSGAPSFKN